MILFPLQISCRLAPDAARLLFQFSERQKNPVFTDRLAVRGLSASTICERQGIAKQNPDAANRGRILAFPRMRCFRCFCERSSDLDGNRAERAVGRVAASKKYPIRRL
ncbi:hypothetical protein [Burkholderia stabilis]|uniref:hypothetical protein n=1 Tax=Burkholderia stabilis TaxID=95485 RepID=UPI001F4B3D1B|nr:hypothetical protein [Burkholderia stabilis]